MKYYIADTHFGHQNILSFAKRPFLSTHEMEEVLISNWNQTIKDKDEVYIIGDLFYREDHPERILSQLKGKKILILGNHDTKWLNDKLKTYFIEINTSMEIIDQNHTIFLCHYPMVSYPKQSRAYMIHGHIHNDTLFDYWYLLLKRSRILNAGVDINHFKPVSFQKLLENNIAYKQKMSDNYPMYLLSIRFYDQNEYTDYWIKEKLSVLSLSEIHKDIYLINDLSDKENIQKYQTEILNNQYLFSSIKNFDVVFIDKEGKYSYLSYIDEKTIYLK